MVKVLRRKKILSKIKEYINKGYSANKIQRELQKEKLGVRRKALLLEIRRMKKYKVSLAEKQKHIPKKYRRKIIREPIRKPEIVYRISYIIPSLPVHSKPFKRRYLGFRMVAFSNSITKLRSNRAFLRRKLIEYASAFAGGNVLSWNNWEVSIGEEPPTQVVVNSNLIDTWNFAVEEEGKEQASRSGNL